MEKFEPILKNVARNVKLTDKEKELFTSIIKTSRVKKRQFVIQPGYPCEYRNYIVKGAFRMFLLDEKGKEHTVNIGIEDWFFTDFYSHIYKKPSNFFAEALEDSVIFQMSYEDVEKTCSKSHAISQYWRVILEKAYANSKNRIVSTFSKTSEERYWEYFNKYPQIVNRVPQYVVASYLGISPEFLSKIRARPLKKT
ncbi:Crp/Fnr family transcriptional regulator [Allomuricauda sp. SCSIO 65647]|uniref:Crp/Fnr family transcriptional regulator n=1 Tax=Allomuricauda sp. SCSIO 65647 TaxID=2908843 RepID=UPI001F195934|nr:Crp/Fnr family transcriptional regulator [Muricauda sp. SCSIO 65647]UJH68610.1 Crp/Fnr family transcriptional regulator [Muricauda sp. SCSIO 65647]